ncbi:MAG: hypothetical protein M0Q22_05045 [Sulfuritalea sp.]|jgi:cystathionine gamma-synthase|nr:hypothetical protein [Sulfuritalea sp.]
MSPVKVISRQPPGGRCTLYGRYAKAISDVLGWNHQVVHSECGDAHGEGFPSLLVRDVAIQPYDGVILSPDDICTHLTRIGIDDALVEGLQSRLEATLNDFLEKCAP